MDADSRVLVIGLGEIGKPLVDVLRCGVQHVMGVDLESVDPPRRVSFAHLCFPFEIPNGFVETAVAYADRFAPEVVIVNSTVVPGTTREIERRSGRPAVYSPVRGKHTQMAAELRHYTKFVAGADVCSVQRVREHFEQAGMKTARMGSSDALELAKLLETTYLALLVAWAQEMNRFSEALDADYLEIAKIFEEVDYLPDHVFVPGFIGGHCLMPNVEILKRRFGSRFLDAVEESNERRAVELGPESRDRSERLKPIRRANR